MLIRASILVDDPDLADRLERVLRQPDVLVGAARVGPPGDEDLWTRLGAVPCDLVFAERDLLPTPYAETVSRLRALPDGPELVGLVERDDSEGRTALQAAGAFAVVDRHLPEATLRKASDTLIRRRREALLGRLRAAAPAAGPDAALDTRSPPMRELFRLAERVTASDSSLLILGETGVGKEWLARWIHARGPRGEGPFVAVNCSALPGELVESELFGHEEGAFTGARRARRGQFELAHRGTLFLDEIAEMPLASQAKLLRAIQDREIRPVGGERPVRVDVRIVAATHRDPEEAIGAQQLREDLFYRLGVVTLEVPPLRERPEDVPALVEELFEELRGRLGRSDVEGVSARVLDAFRAYAWPGNVRELINVLERALLLTAGPAITLDDVPAVLAERSGRPRAVDASPAASGRRAVPRRGWDRFWEASFEVPLSDARAVVVEEYEREYLRRLLERTGGRVGEAARRAGIDERTIYNKMRRYGLAKEEFRQGVR